jgi:hypothetical protein
MTTHLLSFVYSDLALDREIIRHISPVRIYIPWGVQRHEYIDDTEIQVLYPPEELRPAEDINIMLDECYRWAKEQGEKNRNEICKTANSVPVSDESIHSIKTIISGRASAARVSDKEMTIRWHMLLHLADRFEGQRKEANRMLETLRKRRSPLFNHADLTDKTLYPFETLKGMDAEAFVKDSNLRQLLKAWHGLFGGYTGDGDMLLSIDRTVFDYLLNECECFCNNNNLYSPMVFSFKAPLFKEKGELDNAGEDIRTLLSEIRSKEALSVVMDVLKGYESRHCTGPNTCHILFTALYMDADTVNNDPFLMLFSDRIIIHAEIIESPEK